MKDHIEHGIIIDRKKTLIGVTGIGSGAGATFIASSLAIIIGDLVGGAAYIYEGEDCEHCNLGAYRAFEQLSLGSIFDKRKMFDLFYMVKRGLSIEGRANLYHKVNWVVPVPEENRKPELKYVSHSYINYSDVKTLPYESIGGKFIIIDTPAELSEMDKILCIIDPLPSKVKEGIKIFDKLKKLQESGSDKKILWIINKNNEFVNQRQLEKFLGTKADYVLDMIPQEEFYRAEYNCTMPALLRGINRGDLSKGKNNVFWKTLQQIGRNITFDIGF